MIDLVTNVLQLFIIIHLTQERVNGVLSIDGYIKYIYKSQCKCTDFNHMQTCKLLSFPSLALPDCSRSVNSRATPDYSFAGYYMTFYLFKAF